MKCAEILLPLPLQETFTYQVPEDLADKLRVGVRVIVPFGKKKYYSGVVVRVFDSPDMEFGYVLKSILYVIDERPIVSEIQLSLWRWISSYYIANIGDVMNIALPAMFKISSETYITVNPDFLGEVDGFDDRVYNLLDALNENKKLTIKQVESIIDVNNVYKFIQSLVSSGVVDFVEEIKNPYRPKYEDVVEINEPFRNDTAMNELFNSLEKRSYRQMEFMLAYFKCAGAQSDQFPSIPLKLIQNEVKCDRAIANALVKKNVITISKRKVDRIEKSDASDCIDNLQLTDAQSLALEEIKTGMVDKNVILLHGVTSSGKTEIYFKLIEEAVKNKKQVLLLLPDIALTTQIVARTVNYFGHRVGVLHSKFNHNEKVEIWNSVLDNNADFDEGCNIIVGTRSSIFLPFNNLGLIIVDDEHDYSYKQNEFSPRYNARDCAVYLAGLYNSKVVLGSATPSIESYYNAKNNKYGLVTLKERYGGLTTPEIRVVDMKDEKRFDRIKADNYSVELIDAIQAALDAKRQVLVFQNRRGFSLRLECEVCGWVPTCMNCDVSLIYHKVFNQMRCHYCGYHTEIPGACPRCHSTNLVMKGFGTEKVEEDLQTLFPDAVIKRMDLDTTRRKNAFNEIISEFTSGKIDILVGTQMITKGLDFENILLVAVVNADTLLYYPDFRAFERAFQELTQVSGRAGRKKDRGKVIIQTFSPYHSAIVYTVDNDYEKMYYSQIIERQAHKYPPLYRLINVKVKHKDPAVVNEASKVFASLLRQELGDRVLGPEYGSIPRVNNVYIKDIMIKIERNKNFAALKSKFVDIYTAFLMKPQYKGVMVVIDVDPY